MEEYRLHSWGDNSHGQLGVGYFIPQCISPTEVDLSNCTLKPENIKKIDGGIGHTIILDTYGRLYSCGSNNRGQAGFMDVPENILFFKEIMLPKVVDFTCGWDSSAALTQDGYLFVWGSNYYGQLGISSKYDFILSPTYVPLPCRVKRISMGLRHTALLNEDGEVLVCGSDNKGQLGLNILKRSTKVGRFIRIPELYAESVACGQDHTVVSTEDAQLYSFGDNKYGQLGLNPQRVSDTSYPLKIKEISVRAPIKVYSGSAHTSVFFVNSVISWGKNRYGQLGCTESKRPATWKPEYVPNVPNFKQLAVGLQHSVAVAENGTILSWGWNKQGNCGNGSTKNVRVPDKVTIPSNFIGTLVGCGAEHSFAVIRKNN